MGFLAFNVAAAEKSDLLEAIPAMYPLVVADYITIQLKKPEALPHAETMEVIGGGESSRDHHVFW